MGDVEIFYLQFCSANSCIHELPWNRNIANLKETLFKHTTRKVMENIGTFFVRFWWWYRLSWSLAPLHRESFWYPRRNEFQRHWLDVAFPERRLRTLKSRLKLCSFIAVPPLSRLDIGQQISKNFEKHELNRLLSVSMESEIGLGEVHQQSALEMHRHWATVANEIVRGFRKSANRAIRRAGFCFEQVSADKVWKLS